MRKIIYTRPDGGLSVVHPVINTHPEPEEIAEAEAEQRAWKKLPKDAINPQFVEESAIPADRTFRNAWAHGGTEVSVDMEKARDIRRDELRALRAPQLEALDVQFMRALEVDDKAALAEIAARKQALRDVTEDPAIDAAATPEALKKVLPSVLVKD